MDLPYAPFLILSFGTIALAPRDGRDDKEESADDNYSFSIFGITSVAISLSERMACSSVSVPKKRYESR